MSDAVVLIDTCQWAEFFNRPQSPVHRVIDELIEDDRAGVIGPIVAEVLIGFRNPAEADWVASALRGIRYLETTWADWRSAARLGRGAAAAGHLLPLSDLILAAVAQRTHSAVYTIDPHFDRIGNLERYPPG